jgi:acyl-CoA dehydrogenase
VSWDFQTDAEFTAELRWIDEFVRDEIEPLEHVVADGFDLRDPIRQALIPPLQDVVKAKGLWACHLGPELGGPGYGQLRLALINEILGRAAWGPIVFGCQAPDSGNAEVLAAFGTDEHKRRYLEPLLAGRILSAFSMTEPEGGSDPTGLATSARLDGDEWVISGQKWFTTKARHATFILVMAVTDPDAAPTKRASMFIVPADAPGVRIIRNLRLGNVAGDRGVHGYLSYDDARIPAENLLGERGGGFAVAQVRLGGGRIHHAMRTVGAARRVFDMMCERAVSRQSKGSRLADKQLVQQMIAQSWIQLESFRLLVLRTAWKLDREKSYRAVRADISAIKIAMPAVLRDICERAIQIHGSLGVTDELPFIDHLVTSFMLGIADGPTEVHIVSLAREILRDHRAAPDLFPSEHRPRLSAAAHERFAEVLASIAE